VISLAVLKKPSLIYKLPSS